ncbi:hypothetical protein C0J52_11596 [Blattella germanica]|nr:hypothetical protein C0J52_11596 [Blattella germanica]
MNTWTRAQHNFAVKTFWKNGDRYEFAQRRELGIDRNHAVPSANSIEIWVRNLKATGSTVKREVVVLKIRTPDKIKTMREAIERIPHWPALRHSVCLGLSDASYAEIFILTHTKANLPIPFQFLTNLRNQHKLFVSIPQHRTSLYSSSFTR